MLLYPIEAAQRSGLFDLIVVSTDDDQIAMVAFNAGVLVLPRPIDDGTIGTQEIAARVLDRLGYGNGETCVIYPTSPLLEPGDLKHGLAALHNPDLNKRFAMSVGPDGKDAGCWYWGYTAAFIDRTPLEPVTTMPVMLPAARVCDINTPEDFARAETMYDALRRAP